MNGASDHLLHILLETVLSEVRLDQPDLGARHLAAMLTIYQIEETQTVRSLAEHLHITRSGARHALDRLIDLNLARRNVDPCNCRHVDVVRTEAGAAMMHRLADAMTVASATYMPRAETICSMIRPA